MFEMKIFIVLLVLIATAIQLTQSTTLRRKPKIYNALITTDQNLTPSRAYPIIQPHLHETYAYPSYSYRSYSPLGLYNNGFQYGSAASATTSYSGFHGYPRLNTGLEARNFYPRDEIHTTIPPISNDFGLPPSLVPINSFVFGNLAPYPYHSYPIVYDQFGGYGGLLPPYPFYPPGFDTQNPDKAKGDGTGKDDNERNAGDDPKDGEPSGGNNGGSSGGSSGGNGGSSGRGGGSSGSSGRGGDGNGGSSGGGSASGGSGRGGGNGNSGSSGGGSGGSSGNGGSSGSDPSIPDINPLPPVRVKALNE
ncbi:hypothetical protein Bhyg_16623 [Pseudolycoriella hygida]|uniref:Uncharacterized protein n=1 Tax=Pseudolycoriella hygida TaxID=35572 RepID=A0A9Q0RUU9_9DIPT|nr:hypothetical protein Bhyg_16623 [Pseudolycoriella hygida]